MNTMIMCFRVARIMNLNTGVSIYVCVIELIFWFFIINPFCNSLVEGIFLLKKILES